MYVITSKYLPATNHHGSRFSVKHAGRAELPRVSVPYNYAIDTEDNHRQAVLAALRAWKLGGDWVGGTDERCYTFVRVGFGDPKVSIS